MKISQAQGFRPRRAQGYFHTNPDERPSNGLSEAMMKIKRTQGFHPRRVKFDFHTKSYDCLSSLNIDNVYSIYKKPDKQRETVKVHSSEFRRSGPLWSEKHR